jgi:hypothetical protein
MSNGRYGLVKVPTVDRLWVPRIASSAVVARALDGLGAGVAILAEVNYASALPS